MAVNIDLYSENEETTKRVALEINGNVLAPDGGGTSTNEVDYYFTMITSARSTGNVTIPVQVLQDLSTVPDGETPTTYSTITDMVEAYNKWFSEQIDFSI